MSILEADHARIVTEATAEARAAERRHWEARFRNAEQAHAAALAEAVSQERRAWLAAGYKDGRPRTLTADDPEPAVGSVVLFDGLPYIRQGNKWVAPRANSAYWYEFMRDERPTVLIHDGEDR